MKDKIKMLYSKDSNMAYKTLLELEQITTRTNELYKYFDEFLGMLTNEKTLIRVRGFRLICCLSKWDVDNRINKDIDLILKELEDDKGTSVRQCLNSLRLILMYKIELREVIEDKLKYLDASKYKETMQSLIKQDIASILKQL